MCQAAEKRVEGARKAKESARAKVAQLEEALAKAKEDFGDKARAEADAIKQMRTLQAQALLGPSGKADPEAAQGCRVIEAIKAQLVARSTDEEQVLRIHGVCKSLLQLTSSLIRMMLILTQQINETDLNFTVRLQKKESQRRIARRR